MMDIKIFTTGEVLWEEGKGFFESLPAAPDICGLPDLGGGHLSSITEVKQIHNYSVNEHISLQNSSRYFTSKFN